MPRAAVDRVKARAVRRSLSPKNSDMPAPIVVAANCSFVHVEEWRGWVVVVVMVVVMVMVVIWL
jgi:hypothetical protein